jgi:hypothetical protein
MRLWRRVGVPGVSAWRRGGVAAHNRRFTHRSQRSEKVRKVLKGFEYTRNWILPVSASPRISFAPLYDLRGLRVDLLSPHADTPGTPQTPQTAIRRHAATLRRSLLQCARQSKILACLLACHPRRPETYCPTDNPNSLADRPTYTGRDLGGPSHLTLSRISAAYEIRSACPIFMVRVRVSRYRGAPCGSGIYLSVSTAAARNPPGYCPAPFSLVGLGIGVFDIVLLDLGMETL